MKCLGHLPSQPPCWYYLHYHRNIALSHVALVAYGKWWYPPLDPELSKHALWVVWLHHLPLSLEEALMVDPCKLVSIFLPHKITVGHPNNLFCMKTINLSPPHLQRVRVPISSFPGGPTHQVNIPWVLSSPFKS